MESQWVNSYMMQLKKMIPSENLTTLKQSLINATDESIEKLSMIKLHNPIVILFLSWLFGPLAIDRFMLGDKVLGICKLIVCVLLLTVVVESNNTGLDLLCGLIIYGWLIADLFLTYKKAKILNFQNIMSVLKNK